MKTQKNLIVYNTCGIKKDNTYEYPRYIKSLLAQKYKDGTDTKIIVSLCRPREDTVPHLKKVFADQEFKNFSQKFLIFSSSRKFFFLSSSFCGVNF